MMLKISCVEFHDIDSVPSASARLEQCTQLPLVQSNVVSVLVLGELGLSA